MEETYWKEKAEKYKAIAKGCDNARERLKDNLKFAAGILGTDELKGIDVKFKVSTLKPKMIIESALDTKYFVQVITSVPDKEKLRKDLDAGVEVFGAHLEDVRSIRQLVNKGGK